MASHSIIRYLVIKILSADKCVFKKNTCKYIFSYFFFFSSYYLFTFFDQSEVLETEIPVLV